MGCLRYHKFPLNIPAVVPLQIQHAQPLSKARKVLHHFAASLRKNADTQPPGKAAKQLVFMALHKLSAQAGLLAATTVAAAALSTVQINYTGHSMFMRAR